MIFLLKILLEFVKFLIWLYRNNFYEFAIADILHKVIQNFLVDAVMQYELFLLIFDFAVIVDLQSI